MKEFLDCIRAHFRHAPIFANHLQKRNGAHIAEAKLVKKIEDGRGWIKRELRPELPNFFRPSSIGAAHPLLP